MNEDYDDSHHWKTTRTFIYTKSKKLRNVLIYKKPDTFQKARQFPLRFYIQKALHLTLRDFHEFFEVGIYTKSMTLCVTWRFYIQKSGHFAKSKTICDTFLYTKIRHFCVTQFFIDFLKFADGGGHLFIKKNNVLCVTFSYWKNNALCVTLLYKEPDTMRYILISKKQYTFIYVHIYIIYCAVLIYNYKRTYDQSDQIEK